MSPRALEEIVHPRLQSGAGVRPLNFTVRCRMGLRLELRVTRCGAAADGFTFPIIADQILRW